MIGKIDGKIVFVGGAGELAAARESLPEGLVISCTEPEARLLGSEYIERHYPMYKQLNTLRVGTAEEVAKMGAFIDAVRDWSNAEGPDPATLEAIQP